MFSSGAALSPLEASCCLSAKIFLESLQLVCSCLLMFNDFMQVHVFLGITTSIAISSAILRGIAPLFIVDRQHHATEIIRYQSYLQSHYKRRDAMWHWIGWRSWFVHLPCLQRTSHQQPRHRGFQAYSWKVEEFLSALLIFGHLTKLIQNPDAFVIPCTVVVPRTESVCFS